MTSGHQNYFEKADEFDEEYFKSLEKIIRKKRFNEEMDLIYELMPPVPGDKILDVGCGTGRLGLFLLNREKNIEVTFSDVSFQSAKYLLGQKFVVCPSSRMPFSDKYFDKIYCLHMISHVKKIEESISELYRIIKENGELLIITPNKYYVYVLRVAAFLKLIPEYDFDKTAKHLFGKNQLRKFLEKFGWQVKKADYFGSFASKYLNFDFLRWHILLIAKK